MTASRSSSSSSQRDTSDYPCHASSAVRHCPRRYRRPASTSAGRASRREKSRATPSQEQSSRPAASEKKKKPKGRAQVAINNKARLEGERREQVDEAGVTLDRRRNVERDGGDCEGNVGGKTSLRRRGAVYYRSVSGCALDATTVQRRAREVKAAAPSPELLL